MAFVFGPRRGLYIDITQEIKTRGEPLPADEVKYFETLDLIRVDRYLPVDWSPGYSSTPWITT
jgi:hypothetical protein